MTLEMISQSFLKWENNFKDNIDIVMSKDKGKQMKKSLVLISLMVIIFGGCSAKEFNEGVDSITGDISKTFEDGRDK